MTSADHRRITTALGAYLLGALEETERREVSDHLGGCPSCREELANLAGLPSRLGQLELSDLDWLDPTDHRGDEDTFVAAALRKQRRRRRETRTWQAVAAAAAAVALVAVVTRPADGPDPSADPVAMAARDGSNIVATAVTVQRLWGTELRIDALDLPASPGYELWALSDTGERQLAGTWNTSPTHRYRVTGATGIATEDLARIEIARVDTGAVITTATV